MGRNGFHVGSSSEMAMSAVIIAMIAIPIGVIGWVMPIAGTNNSANTSQCLASPNFIVSTSMFECIQSGIDYGLFMWNYPCGKLAMEWFSTGASGFTNANFASTTNSY